MDLYYFDEDYFTPSLGYFVYTASAASAVTSTATVTCAIDNRTRSQSSAVTSTATLAVNGGLLQEAVVQITGYFEDNYYVDGYIKQDGSFFTLSVTLGNLEQFAAAIECVSTVSASTVATRAFNVTLESIVTQSLQSQRLAGLTSNQSAQFSISASGNETTQGTASLSTTATVSATTSKLQLYSATLVSTSTVTAQVLNLGARPLQVVQSADASISTAQQKFGPASLLLNNGNVDYYASNRLIPSTTDDYYISAWVWPNNITTSRGIMTHGAGTLDTIVWRIYSERVGSTNRLTFESFSSSGLIGKIQSPTGFTNASWNHIAVSRKSGVYALWLNGTRQTTVNQGYPSTALNTLTPEFYAFQRFRVGRATLTGSTVDNWLGYIDEVEMKIGTFGIYDTANSSYTQPDSASANDETQTRFLFHYDVDFSDDISKQFNAALNSSVTVTATASRTRVAVSAITSTATVTANTVTITQAQANLTSNGFVVAVTGRIKAQVANLDTAFALTANAGILKEASANITSTSSLTASALDLDLATAALTSQFALTAQGRFLFLAGIANIVSTATLTANATEISTPDELLVSTTRALFHLDAVPAINVHSSSTSISTGSATVTTGKFTNGLAMDQSTGKSLASTLGFELDAGVDFVYDFWWARGNDIPAFGLTDTVISSVANGGRTSVTYPNSTTGLHDASINMYSSAYHGATGYNWGLTDGTVYINWPFNSTFDPSDTQNSVASYQITDNNFHHFLYSRTRIDASTATYRLFIDGVEVIEYTGTYVQSSSATTGITFGSVGERYSVGDEWRLVKGITQTTNFTPNAAPYFPPNIQFARNFNALLEPATQLSIDFLKVKLVQGALTSAFTQTAANSRTRTTSVAVASQFAQTTAATKVVFASANLSTTASQTAIIGKLVSLTCAMTDAFAQTTQERRLRDVPAALACEATTSATAKKFTGVVSTVSAEFAQVVINTRIRDVTTQFNSIATEVTAAFKNATGTVLMESQITFVAAVNVRPFVGAAALSVQVSVVVDSGNVLRAQANVASQVSVTTEATKFRPVAAALTTTASQTTTLVKIARANAGLTSTTTLSVAPVRILQYSSNQVAQVTVTATGSRFRLGAANLTSQASITAVVTPVVRFTAVLTSAGFVVSVGSIIHIDPYTTYVIPQETRNTLITEESRLYVINQETRVNTIIGSAL